MSTSLRFINLGSSSIVNQSKGSFTYDVITLGGGRGFPNDDD